MTREEIENAYAAFREGEAMKIIRIVSHGGFLYALTENGEIFRGILENNTWVWEKLPDLPIERARAKP